jgi:hypothetical protein
MTFPPPISRYVHECELISVRAGMHSLTQLICTVYGGSRKVPTQVRREVVSRAMVAQKVRC